MNIDDVNRIFDVLVQHAGAYDDGKYSRDVFVLFCMDPESREYRFQGTLGFGGKFWLRDMRVSCYPEDMTPERRAVIEATNKALRELIQKPAQ